MKWIEARDAMSVRRAAWERVSLTDDELRVEDAKYIENHMGTDEAEAYIANLAYEAGYRD